jgi:glutamate/tyrosine decarboxylase-like PLP-dependent enzyme
MEKNYSTLSKNEIEPVINYISDQALKYMKKLDNLPIRTPNPHKILESFDESLPINGEGAIKTLRKLMESGLDASTSSSGPRFFHFVTGGTTPAALGADWITTILDQNAYAFISSALAAKLEGVSIKWLLEIFRLPASWGGVITTGTTMSNFVCLAAARQWIGEIRKYDISERGLYGMDPIPIFSSDIIHQSDVKALGMLGFGRGTVKKIPREDSSIFDLEKLEIELKKLDGAPSIIIAVAGDPNAGEFDPIEKLVELALNYNAWLHVDGAFGAFAQLSDTKKYLLKNLERSHSLAVDGHKWLNVPYDCGFAFVSNPELLVKNFTFSAVYLPKYNDKEQVFGALGPEMSRRARSFAVWATLHAYGKKGLTELINLNLRLAEYLGELVERDSNLELLAPVLLNVVCFRYNNQSSESDLDKINTKLGEEIITDGRVYLGTTKFNGKVALRPAISNWRTEKVDIDLLYNVVLELGNKIAHDF